MTKLRIRVHKAKKSSPKARAVSKKLKAASGQIVTVRAIQANSQSFADDFLSVFRENVREARKENRAVSAAVSHAAKTA